MAEQPDVASLYPDSAMSRLHRPRYQSARAIAARLGVPVDTFLRLYEQPHWRVPRPRVIRDRARWDMVEIEYWLDTLAQVSPPPLDEWLAVNGHRVAPYTVGWSLLELLRPRWWHPTPPSAPAAA